MRDGREPCDERLAQARDLAHIFIHMLDRLAQRRRHAGDARRVFRAAALAALLRAALDDTRERDAALGVQKADTAWSVEFVRRA